MDAHTIFFSILRHDFKNQKQHKLAAEARQPHPMFFHFNITARRYKPSDELHHLNKLGCRHPIFFYFILILRHDVRNRTAHKPLDALHH